VKRRSTAGFTLLELLIVIAIGLVLTGMAIPLTINTMRSYELSAAVSAVTGALQSTRYAAVMHGYSYQLTLTQGTNTYQVLTEIPPATTFTAVTQTGNSTSPTSAVPFTGAGGISLSRTVTYQFAAGGTVTETSTPANMQFSITNAWGGSNTVTVSGVGNVSVSSP
jgi:prepilin-type N-terminal cleavage/methylation domain-containing protein